MSRAAGRWLAPLVPLGTGAAIMIAAGAPRSRWALHLASGAVGLLAYFAVRGSGRALPRAISPQTRARFAAATVPVLLSVLVATLAAEGLDGVRRWLRLGPVRLHPSALFSPLLLVLAWHEAASRPRRTLLVLASIQAVHIAQPDAGQATAFGVATLVLLFGRRALLGTTTAALAAVIAAASIAIAWARPDPLAPAPFVEDIVQRAFGLGRPWGVLALVSLIPLLCAPLLGREPLGIPPPAVSVRTALVAYLACSLAVVLLGEFPVPLLGFGPSPAIGAFVGLAALRRAEDVDAVGERN
jgi:hypothetical protein